MTVKVYLGASHTKLGGTPLSFNVLIPKKLQK